MQKELTKLDAPSLDNLERKL
jgi:calpain